MIDILNKLIQDGADRGLLQKSTDSEFINSSEISIENEKLINFGSCSYLGLEYHPNLKRGVCEAVEKFGTQFSTSRTYLSIGLYDKLELELEKIYQKPVIVSASTSLGHLACLPVVVEEGDAVILDLQVHSSVQMTTQILKAQKVPTFLIPHNSMEALEAKIKTLSGQYKRIWYFADGIYSMYGDFAPLKELERLMNEYPKFHLYIDDAHGMSWTGENGTGYVRSQIEHHDKMILAVSLNKAFASAGGTLVFPNEKWRNKVRNCGSTLIFSGPIQPPMLGAAIESVKLHQTEEFKEIQNELKAKVAYTNKRLNELNLPQYQETDSPLFFIPVGLPRAIIAIIKRMKRKGFFLNSAGFPATPMKKGGIRFMITNNLSYEEIENMLVTLKEEYIYGLHEEESSPEKVAKSFKIKPFLTEHSYDLKEVSATDYLEDSVHDSISEIDSEEWNKMFAHLGSNEHKNLTAIEKLFQNQTETENNWDIKYHVVRDKKGKIILASVFSIALMMDDLLSTRSISEKIKEIRKTDKYYLTSKNLLSGTPFTKGKSVYVNYEHNDWKEAVKLHVNYLQEIAESKAVSKLVLREFCTEETEQLREYLLELGLFDMKLPDNFVVKELGWKERKEHAQRLSSKYRYSLKKEILKKEHLFLTTFDKPKTEAERKRAYELYLNVYEKANDISVFQLPYELFERMFEDESYDIIQLHLKDNPTKPIATMFSQIIDGIYHAQIVGLDYKYVKSHNTYKQILYQTVMRANSLGCKKVDMAYTAEMEKKKVGAEAESKFAFTMAFEHDSYAELENLK